MEELAAKLISLGVLIVLTLAFSVIPYFLVLRGSRSLVSNRRRDTVIAVLNCFGGGVFLATLLLHLMTEGSDEFEVYKSKSGWKTNFPFFNLFVSGGFFVVAFIEFFMHSHLHNKRSHSHVNNVDSLTHDQGHVFQGQYGAMGSQRKEAESRPGFSSTRNKDITVYVRPHEGDELMSGGHQQPVATSADVMIESNPQTGLIGRGDHGQHNHQSENVQGRGSSAVSGISDMIADFPDGLRAFLLLFALSFHTIFDGLAVGLQDSVSEVWQVFAAISIHKSIIAFCLGLELFKCHPDTPWRAFAWICFFSIMAPIGIGLGIGLTSGGVHELAKLLSSSILQGVAAGTFLYVTFLEILSQYLGHSHHRKFVHILFALIGFAFMACVKLIDND